MSKLSLSNLLVPSKSATVTYPGMPEFQINVCFLSRETLQKMRASAMKTTFKNRQPIEELNDELFLELYVNATVKGWTGLKYGYIEQLAPVDLGDTDRNLELEYSPAEALLLMKSSINFDNFISETATELGNFTSSK